MVAMVGVGSLVWVIARPNTLLGGVLTGMVATTLGILAEALLRSATREHLVAKLEKPSTDELRSLFEPAFQRIRTHRFYETFKQAMGDNDAGAREYFWVNVKRGGCYGFMNQALRAMQENQDPEQIQVDNNEIIYSQLLQFMWGAFVQLGTEEGRKSFQVNPTPEILAVLPDMAKVLEKELLPWNEIKSTPFSALTSAQNYNEKLTRLAGVISTFSGHIDIYGTSSKGPVGLTMAFTYSPQKYLIADSWEFYQYENITDFTHALRDRVVRKFKDCDQAQATFYIKK